MMRMSGPHGRVRYEGFGRFDLKSRPATQVRQKIGHIAGGTGITPIYQVLQAALKNKDGSHHQLVFGNRSVSDILLRDELEALEEAHPDNFQLYFTVDQKPSKDVKWDHGVGFVTKEMLEGRIPEPSLDTMILYCGPPAFTDMLTRVLIEEMGYCETMLFKF